MNSIFILPTNISYCIEYAHHLWNICNSSGYKRIYRIIMLHVFHIFGTCFLVIRMVYRHNTYILTHTCFYYKDYTAMCGPAMSKITRTQRSLDDEYWLREGVVCSVSGYKWLLNQISSALYSDTMPVLPGRGGVTTRREKVSGLGTSWSQDPRCGERSEI